MLTLSAVKLAIENINEDPDLLNSYDIELLPVYIKDPEQDPTEMIRILYQQYNDLPIHGVIGPYHTDIAQMFAYVFGHYLPTLQISYSVTDASLHDKSQYPYFYTMVPTDQFLNKVRIELLNHFGWRKIGVLCSDDSHLVLATQDLISQLERPNNDEMNVNYLGSFILSPNEILTSAKSEDIRIFIAIVQDTLARTLLCQAYRTNLTTADHVWILPGIYDPQWWSIGDQAMNSTEYNCTDEQMMEAINSTLFVDTLPTYLNDLDPQIERILSDIFNKTEIIQDNSFSLSNTEFHQLLHSQALNAYDATRALALAWDVTLHNFTENELHVLLNYDQSWKVTAESKQELVKRLQYNLENIISPYSGLAGMYLFNSTQNTFGGAHALITQFIGDSECVLGIYESLNNGTLSTLQGCELEQCCNATWKGNYQPTDRDGRLFTCRLFTFRVKFLLLTFAILSILGIMVSIALQGMNRCLRNNKHFKSSSPWLNAIITVGCSLEYFTVCLLLFHYYIGINGSNGVSLYSFCNVTMWFFWLPIVLISCSILIKNWRIFRIFYNPSQKKRKHLSNRSLYFGIAILITPVILILIVIIALDPLTVYTIDLKTPCPNFSVGHVIEDHCIEAIATDWNIAIAIYVFLLSLSIFVLGCYNCRISNHYKKEGELAILTGLVSMLIFVFLYAFTFADTGNQGFSYIEGYLPYIVGSLWIYPSFTLTVLYLPKAISIFKDKRRDTYRPRNNSTARKKSMLIKKFVELHNEMSDLKWKLSSLSMANETFKTDNFINAEL